MYIQLKQFLPISTVKHDTCKMCTGCFVYYFIIPLYCIYLFILQANKTNESNKFEDYLPNFLAYWLRVYNQLYYLFTKTRSCLNHLPR